MLSYLIKIKLFYFMHIDIMFTSEVYPLNAGI